MAFTLTTTLLALLTASFVFAAPKPRLFHRVFHPSIPDLPFAHRATLAIEQGTAVALHPSSSLSQDLIGFAQALQGTVDGALYQVALEHAGDTTDAQWDISSVKACHLGQATSEFIYLHTADLDNPNPHAIDYFVSPTPHDGACPHSASKKLKSTDSTVPFNSASALHAFAKNVNRLNTTVTLRGPRLPPLPELRTPPTLTPEGEPVVPVPEKSFLQKYWMYMVAIMVITLLSGGSEEEKKRD